MLKKVQVYWSFWYSYSLAVSVICDVMPGYGCFVCIVMRLRLDKKFIYYTILYFKNLFLLRYAYMLCNVLLSTLQ